MDKSIERVMTVVKLSYSVRSGDRLASITLVAPTRDVAHTWVLLASVLELPDSAQKAPRLSVDSTHYSVSDRAASTMSEFPS